MNNKFSLQSRLMDDISKTIEETTSYESSHTESNSGSLSLSHTGVTTSELRTELASNPENHGMRSPQRMVSKDVQLGTVGSQQSQLNQFT